MHEKGEQIFVEAFLFNDIFFYAKPQVHLKRSSSLFATLRPSKILFPSSPFVFLLIRRLESASMIISRENLLELEKKQSIPSTLHLMAKIDLKEAICWGVDAPGIPHSFQLALPPEQEWTFSASSTFDKPSWVTAFEKVLTALSYKSTGKCQKKIDK